MYAFINKSVYHQNYKAFLHYEYKNWSVSEV